MEINCRERERDFNYSISCARAYIISAQKLKLLITRVAGPNYKLRETEKCRCTIVIALVYANARFLCNLYIILIKRV